MLVLVEFWLDGAVCLSGHLGGGEGGFLWTRVSRLCFGDSARREGGREALWGLGGK